MNPRAGVRCADKSGSRVPTADMSAPILDLDLTTRLIWTAREPARAAMPQRAMKYDKLQVRWSKREKDVLFVYPRKADGALMNYFFCFLRSGQDKTLLEELEERGYDTKTLKFSISQKEPKSALDSARLRAQD
jgi:hypothetical protein